MENPVYIGLSRQVALRNQMDLIANNVANMSTPGYRAQNMVFSEFVEKPGGKHDSLKRQDPISMVLDYGHYQVNEPGPMQLTGNQTDIALNGPGFVGVQMPGSDETLYTRAGNFQVNVSASFDLGKIAYPPQKGIGDPWSAAAPPRNLISSLLADLHA